MYFFQHAMDFLLFGRYFSNIILVYSIVDRKKLIYMRIGTWPLYVLAVLLLSLGLWRGEERQVLRKAMMICLECIGIG